jgi:hypothetical protein
VNINLHLTDDTQLRAHGFVAGSGLFAEVQWDLHGPFPDSPGDGVLWGTPAMMRQLAELAELAVQAAVQAEEEAAWQARLAGKRPTEGAQVA